MEILGSFIWLWLLFSFFIVKSSNSKQTENVTHTHYTPLIFNISFCSSVFALVCVIRLKIDDLNSSLLFDVFNSFISCFRKPFLINRIKKCHLCYGTIMLWIIIFICLHQLNHFTKYKLCVHLLLTGNYSEYFLISIF